MNIVYVVWHNHYDDSELMDVFSTRELAQKAIDDVYVVKRWCGHTCYEIVEKTIDVISEE